jgi:hypothetical protein
MREREVHGHPPAHRVPDEGRAFDAGRVHHGGEIRDVRVRLAGFESARATVAAEVVAHDPIRAGEHAELLVPDS